MIARDECEKKGDELTVSLLICRDFVRIVLQLFGHFILFINNSHLKEEALDRNMWRTRFGRGFGPVVRQTTESINQ
jgi:hypothetical protein